MPWLPYDITEMTKVTYDEVGSTGHLLAGLDLLDAKFGHLVVVDDFVCDSPTHVNDLEVQAMLAAEGLEVGVC